MEYIILKVFLQKEKFLKYFSSVDLSFFKENYREVYKLFLVLQKMQEEESKDYTLEDLQVALHTQYPVMKQDDRLLFDSIFHRLDEIEIEDGRVVEYLEQLRQQTIAAKIASISVDVALGKKRVEELHPLWEQLKTPIEDISDSPFVEDTVESLYGETATSGYLYWRLETLNKMLGPIRKGDFGFLFARPETGKTTFLASEVTYMAEQLKEWENPGPIIWFNNEEAGSKVQKRCHQAALGITKGEFANDVANNKSEYDDRTNNLIKIVDDASLSKRKIERICAEYKPSLIIFDQIDKIQGFTADRHDLVLKAVYQFARELAKMYGPVLGVCQAGGTAEGKKYLNMNDVDSSHTAKQGEADFMFGIGATNHEGEEYVRYLSICKNKLEGPGLIEELRHGKMSVRILPTIGRYEDAMVWD